MKLSNLKPNPNNPRIIKDDKFKKLVKSIEEFPEMMAKRTTIKPMGDKHMRLHHSIKWDLAVPKILSPDVKKTGKKQAHANT